MTTEPRTLASGRISPPHTESDVSPAFERHTRAIARQARLEDLAADVGRLRRLLEPETSLAHLGERIAGHVEALTIANEPTAAELYRLFRVEAGGDEELAVDEALAAVDRRARQLRATLDPPRRG